MVCNAPQRKYRNHDEKAAICLEVSKNLVQLPIQDDTCVGLNKLKDVLQAFLDSEKGHFKGTIPIPELNAIVDYDLPTRRVLRHFVRFGKAPEAPKNSA